MKNKDKFNFETLESWIDHLAVGISNITSYDLNCQKYNILTDNNLTDDSNSQFLVLDKINKDGNVLNDLNIKKFHPVYKYQRFLQQKALNFIPLLNVETISNYRSNYSINFQFPLFFKINNFLYKEKKSLYFSMQDNFVKK